MSTFATPVGPPVPSPPPPRRVRHLLAVGLGALLLLAGAAPVRERPALAHVARDSAPAGQPLQVEGTLQGGARLVRLSVRFRGPGRAYEEAWLERGEGDTFQGVIPAAAMTAPGVEYYVEGTTARGDRIPVFRSADRPARVLVFRGAVAAEPPRADEPPARPPVAPGQTPTDGGEPPPAPPARVGGEGAAPKSGGAPRGDRRS